MRSRCRRVLFLLCRRWTRPRIPNRRPALAEGNWLGRGQGPFWQPPLYPYFLGVIKLVFSESFYYVSRFAQALIGSLTCVLLYLVGRRLFGSGVGFIGGLIAAAYGPLIYFDARLLPAGLATFFTLVSLLLLMRAVERPTKSIFTAAGFALGLASLTAAILASLIPGVAIWLFYWLRKKAALAVVAFLLGAMLAIAPVTLRNYIIGGDFVPISYNGGVNFYIGNNANVEQTLALCARDGSGRNWLLCRCGKGSRCPSLSPCSFTGRLLSTYRMRLSITWDCWRQKPSSSGTEMK